uniref:Uncharacterized protein n=1 Tax=Meloidogyne enterolobii TaxID=390850 RepID=A0A6V7WW16_MELEN|nr:unnamed protein product [Meloidogyne enterolobii]
MSENNFNSIEENHKNYKDKLLSSYWTEFNLIGYKIELLGKQKVEYPKELKSRIIYIGNKISGIVEANKRHCFTCRDTQTIKWGKYLKENYLCYDCYRYKRRNDGKHRPMKFWLSSKKVYFFF